ncbi:MAG: excinuclease ABC subunit UvrA [Candidatus Heimdallarchaeota archaeon]|nr:excinuclease ABC subunit UvrA [Candidatus Heimdallarchaeota archaeon]
MTVKNLRQNIFIKGAKQHNLKNVDLIIPRDKLVVLTGVSGSGKSSLAFDTLFAEGQRRYIESLSAYARQFMDQMSKPDVESIEGLSPTVSISQKTTSYNPRSTVGTVTEIYDFLRVLFARIGIPHCPNCGREIRAQTITNIVDQVLEKYAEKDVLILAPIVRDRKGEYQKELQGLREGGYARARIDFEIKRLDELSDEEMILSRYYRHTIEAVIDRLTLKKSEESRLAEAIEQAIMLSDGLVTITTTDATHKRRRLAQENKEESQGKEEEKAEEKDIDESLFSVHLACPICGISFPKVEPRNFSFNSVHGACPNCKGLGTTIEFDPDLFVVDKNLSLVEGALADYSEKQQRFRVSNLRLNRVKAVAEKLGFTIDTPLKDLSEIQWEAFFFGKEEPIKVDYEFSWKDKRGGVGKGRAQMKFPGLVPLMKKRYKKTKSQYIRNFIQDYTAPVPCPECYGSGLKAQARAVTFKGRNLAEIADLSITSCVEFFNSVQLTKQEKIIGESLFKEIKMRLQFLLDVGLPYLTLSRRANTLSGGESQRIRLGTQIGSGLEDVLYILDEPSIGLHNRDNLKLIHTLQSLRDKGNTVLVSEHDLDTMLAADWLIDVGPKAGHHGGQIIAEGPLEVIHKNNQSITAQYLLGKKHIKVPENRRKRDEKAILKVFGAAENNLKGIDVEFPLGLFICVTGVSGSGKSSLVTEVLWTTLAKELNRAKTKPGKHELIVGTELLDKVIAIDQTPIGYTPRSVPATYTKVFDHIRVFFASLPISRARGYKKGRFSFNTKAGQCKACKGLGYNKIEMQFLPDVEVECEVCGGKRYSPETLEIKYQGNNIAQVLDMTVDEAVEFFQDHPKIVRILQTLQDVGLGYLKLGQPSPTLSGGEAQRVKISRELSKRSTGQTLYLLEEPTVGLHSFDIEHLLEVLNRLVDAGNTVIVVEHNLDVIKCADWIIDLGPEGGDEGGKIVAAGTPEELSKNGQSYTGQALRKVLGEDPVKFSSPSQRKKDNELSLKDKTSELSSSSRQQSSQTTSPNTLSIFGARKNNLKNINVTIPKDKLTVITGISGSGKSSLAIDTIFAEGQRRFVESLSTYARQFLGRMDSTEVDKITGLSPAIAIDQKSAGRNPRSTVGTTTEINDYLRLLFATVGITYCPVCGKDISPLTLKEMVRRTLALGEETRIRVIAPLVKNSKGDFIPLFKELIKEGFTRIMFDDEERLLEDIKLSNRQKTSIIIDKEKEHTIELIIDRLIIGETAKEQLFESIETALIKSDGIVKITTNGTPLLFSTKRECFTCGVKMPEKLSPKMFSFNSHAGACEKCDGLGTIKTIDPEAFITDPNKSIREGAIGPISENKSESSWIISLISGVAKEYGFTLDTPIKDLTKKQYNVLMYGAEQKIKVVRNVKRKSYAYTYERDREFKGLIPMYEKWLTTTTSFWWINRMEKYTNIITCPNCQGARLKPTSLAVRVGGATIKQVSELSIAEAYEFFSNLVFGGADQIIAEGLIEELLNRFKFLKAVGLDYLTLNREARTLSGGEAQRIRLATQIGNKLVGVLYVLDEPSIGLHPRDNDRLIKTLKELRDLGNTVVIIEHDEATIRNADYIIDLGPGAGREGGEVVTQGSLKNLLANKESLTANYLSGRSKIPIPAKRRKSDNYLTVKGATHNNLRDITVKFPLGVFTCLTGVSGSGKSSLLIETLYRVLAKEFHRAKTTPGDHKSIEGLEKLDKVILIDQDPIGRTPRSNPATYTGVFDHIRELFATLPEAKMNGFTISRFSFNNSKGRCRACRGRGIKKVEMLFLSDVEITCGECKGKRYNRETLKVRFKGKNIADVLDMTVNEALEFFANQPKISRILQIMAEVGLGYIQLGQSATTLSGGEAMRVKLAAELCRPQTSKTLYLLDEPTIGLSAYDIHKLLNILEDLVEKGNTVIIIEHNLEVVKCADWVIDLGPEGGDKGGMLVAEGTPEKIVQNPDSITAKFLKAVLNKYPFLPDK